MTLPTFAGPRRRPRKGRETNMIESWGGKSLADMTRDELIEALETCNQERRKFGDVLCDVKRTLGPPAPSPKTSPLLYAVYGAAIVLLAMWFITSILFR